MSGARHDRVRDITVALLAARAPTATLCPSEVARAVGAEAGTDWRDEMPAVHVAVQELVAESVVRLSWRGVTRQVGDGPYRIGRVSGPGPLSRNASD